MSRYLVTGGAGFIGSHLAEALVALGHQVRVLDNFATGKRENLAHLKGRIELVEADIRDLEAVREAMEGVEVVFHQAALPSVPRSLKDPLTTHQVNATGTLHVLLAAREAGVRRLVYASSSSVYGDTPELPKREDLPPRPKSPYAASKLAGEHYCQAYWSGYGLETVCLRYFNVFGPRQDPGSPYAAAIPLFASALLDGGLVRVYGTGDQTRDFTYVANVVQANLLAAAARGAGGTVCNIACGQQTSILALLSTLGELMGCAPRVQFDPPRPGDVKHSLADLSRASRILGYRPTTSLREGLAETVRWVVSTGAAGPGSVTSPPGGRAPRLS